MLDLLTERAFNHVVVNMFYDVKKSSLFPFKMCMLFTYMPLLLLQHTIPKVLVVYFVVAGNDDRGDLEAKGKGQILKTFHLSFSLHYTPLSTHSHVSKLF